MRQSSGPNGLVRNKEDLVSPVRGLGTGNNYRKALRFEIHHDEVYKMIYVSAETKVG